MKHLIALVGRKGSGKGTVAEILKTEYGATVFRFSDVLRQILELLLIEKTRENLVRLSEALRRTFGQDILKRVVQHRAKQAPANLIVFDGVRRGEDLEGLNELGEVRIVEVAAPLEIRYERVRQRGENAGETTQTFASFQELEHAPTEVTIADVEAKATICLDNSGTLEDLKRRIRDMMHEP